MREIVKCCDRKYFTCYRADGAGPSNRTVERHAAGGGGPTMEPVIENNSRPVPEPMMREATPVARPRPLMRHASQPSLSFPMEGKMLKQRCFDRN